MEISDRLLLTLSALDDWSCIAIETALDGLSQATCVRRAGLDAVLSVFVLTGHTPLPPAAVLEVLGPDECKARLCEAARVYRACQLIG